MHLFGRLPPFLSFQEAKESTNRANSSVRSRCHRNPYFIFFYFPIPLHAGRLNERDSRSSTPTFVRSTTNIKFNQFSYIINYRFSDSINIRFQPLFKLICVCLRVLSALSADGHSLFRLRNF